MSQPLPEKTDATYFLSPDFSAGYVAIIGRPNVGKSTLLNALLGQKIAITSPKPQTTRNRLLGIVTNDDAQLICIDTPGLHHPKNKLGQFMVDEASASVPDADVILWLVDVSTQPKPEDAEIATWLARRAGRLPVVIGFNKADLVDETTLTANRNAFLALLKPAASAVISAAQRHGLDALLSKLTTFLPLSAPYFPPDQVTDAQERFIAAELVREQALHSLRDEIPHAMAVVVEEFKVRNNGITYIAATIFVERDTQKAIVLGQGGRTLKQIGQAARLEIEQLLETQVFLELWVKVAPHWRRDAALLRRMGYAIPR